MAPVQIRFEKSTPERLAKLEAKTGLTKALAIRIALDAFLTEFERTGRVTLPCKFTFSDS